MNPGFLGSSADIPVAGGGANNLALVAGHFGGSVVDGPTSIAFAFDSSHQVTTGNFVLVGIAHYNSSHTFAAGDLTKTSGTATIGTVVLDQASNSVSNTAAGVAIFRVPVTGSGTLTLTYSGGAGSLDLLIGAAEFTGQNASPLGTTSVATGTGTAHSTGSVTTSVPGIIFYVATELAGTNFSRTISDTTIFHQDTAASTFTGVVQFKTISSSPNTLTDTTGTDSSNWKVAYAQYKTS